MRQTFRAPALELALLAAVPSACSIAVAPIVTQVPDQDRQWSVGNRVSSSLHPGRDQGPVLAFETEQLWGLGETRYYSPDQFRYKLGAGYASLPLPHRPARVGYEALLESSFGKYAREDEIVDAFGAGIRLGLPLRLSPTVERWNAEAKLTSTFLLSPAFGTAIFWPINPWADRDPALELSFGVAARIHIWSSLLP